jgi:RNA polymerase sigma-70 factor (ECF subfamily)
MNAAKTPPDDELDAHPAHPAHDVDDWALAPDAGDEAAEDVRATPAVASKRAAAPAATEQQLAGWIEAVVDQDERALAALYDATFTRVFGLVQRIVRDSALAEEVVEDAYFQVWRQAVRFDPTRGKALTWLLAMARSRAIDALRREARFDHDTLDGYHRPETASAQPPHDELLDLARHQADLHQALMLLGAQPRQLVSMSFFRGLSHEEIAEQMGLPLGTVKSQIRRALLALRDAVGEGGSRLLAS